MTGWLAFLLAFIVVAALFGIQWERNRGRWKW